MGWSEEGWSSTCWGILKPLFQSCTGSTAFKGPGTWRGDSGRGRGWQEGANLPAGAPGPWTGLQLRPNLGQRQLGGPLQEAVGVSSRAPSWRPRNPYLGSAHSCPGKRCHLRCSPHSLSNSTDPRTSPSLAGPPDIPFPRTSTFLTHTQPCPASTALSTPPRNFIPRQTHTQGPVTRTSASLRGVWGHRGGSADLLRLPVVGPLIYSRAAGGVPLTRGRAREPEPALGLPMGGTAIKTELWGPPAARPPEASCHRLASSTATQGHPAGLQMRSL